MLQQMVRRIFEVKPCTNRRYVTDTCRRSSRWSKAFRKSLKPCLVVIATANSCDNLNVTLMVLFDCHTSTVGAIDYLRPDSRYRANMLGFL